MKKRILSILLLCCMVLTLLPTTAFAADESPAVTNVTVTFDSNGGGEVESQTIQQGSKYKGPLTLSRKVILLSAGMTKTIWTTNTTICRSGISDIL